MDVLSSWHDHASFNTLIVEDVVSPAIMAEIPVPGLIKSDHESPGSSSSDAYKISESGASSSSTAGKVQKRARTSKPKVKTGCSVCKQRRIKCDEKRPSCTQCIRARKECLGYPPPARHALPLEGVRIAPRPALAAARLASSRSSVPLAPNPGGFTMEEAVPPPRRANKRQQSHPQLQSQQLPTQQHQQMMLAKKRDLEEAMSLSCQSPTTFQPIPGLSFTASEVRYFELFRTQTIAGLAGLFDSCTWRQRVLHDCHGEAAIKHSAIALGALFKTLEQSSRTPSPASPSRDVHADAVLSHWQVAVQQYSKACNAIMSPNGGQSQQQYDRTRLLVSILLGTFDAFIGDHKQAIVQIQNGLSLMEKLVAGGDQPPREPSLSTISFSSIDTIEDDLAVVLTRIALSAKTYDWAFHFPEPYVIQFNPSTKDGPPRAVAPKMASPFSPPVKPGHHFSSIREARFAHDGLKDRGIRFLDRLQRAQNTFTGILPDSWKQYGKAYLEEMNTWEAAFRPLFESRLNDNAALSIRDRSDISTLKVEHDNARIVFLSIFSPTEAIFDTFIPQFASIVQLSREVVANDETQAATAAGCILASQQNGQSCQHQRWDDPPSVTAGGYATYHVKPSFRADLGIVPSLFLVVTKCREPVIRRQAIQLLRSSARREGMWDSEFAARIGQWIMELEEGPGPYQQRDDTGGPPRLDIPYGSGMMDGNLEGSFAFGGCAYPSYSDSQAQSTLLGGQPQPVPEERRVRIHAIDFDLRARVADITVGTRGLTADEPQDSRRKFAHISW